MSAFILAWLVATIGATLLTVTERRLARRTAGAAARAPIPAADVTVEAHIVSCLARCTCGHAKQLHPACGSGCGCPGYRYAGGVVAAETVFVKQIGSPADPAGATAA